MMDQALRFLIPGGSQEVERNECISLCARSCIYNIYQYLFSRIYIVYSVIIHDLASTCTRRFYLRINQSQEKYIPCRICFRILLDYPVYINHIQVLLLPRRQIRLILRSGTSCDRWYLYVACQLLASLVLWHQGSVSCRFGRWFLWDRAKMSRGISLKGETHRRTYWYQKLSEQTNPDVVVLRKLPANRNTATLRAVLGGGTIFSGQLAEKEECCMLLPFVLAQRTKDNLRFWQWTLWHGCSLALWFLFGQVPLPCGSNHAHK